jgi:hypothetical protein
LVVSAAALALAACAQGSVTTGARAAQVVRMQCPSADASQDEAQVLERATVLKVEPHFYWDRCFGIAKVTSTTLLVQRPAGVSVEQLEKDVQCASARTARVQGSASARDPYGLPGAWVDIEMKPEGDDLVITLQADSVPNNIRLLRQATAFAAAQHPGGLRASGQRNPFETN